MPSFTFAPGDFGLYPVLSIRLCIAVTEFAAKGGGCLSC